LHFPEIPSKVTLNEYLEIVKDYSTPSSNNFVNGVLDKLVREFTQEKRMIKTGRGLL
jgi:N utilization substance protein B